MCDTPVSIEDFKIDYAIAHNYNYIKTLSEKPDAYVILVQYRGATDKYILKIGKRDVIFPEVFVSLQFKCEKLTTNLPKRYKFGKVDSSFVDKYHLKSHKNLYFILIEYLGPNNFEDVLMYKLINLYKFKQLMVQFIRFYIKANKKLGFIHYNMKFQNLIFEIKKDEVKKLCFIDLGNSITTGLKKQKFYSMKLYEKYWKARKYVYTKPWLMTLLAPFGVGVEKNIDQKALNRNKNYYKKMDVADTSIYEINYNNNGNYDIIVILRLINTAERVLNKLPKQITLSKDQIKYFNSHKPLYEKLEYLLKFNYFKTYY